MLKVSLMILKKGKPNLMKIYNNKLNFFYDIKILLDNKFEINIIKEIIF